MKDEILAAVLFIVRLIEKNEKFSTEKLDVFKARLIDLLTERFQNHWFPNDPAKGQGYRCIRLNELCPVDLVLQKAAQLAGLNYRDLQLPIELTLWVDPNEVCCRFGETEGSYCTLASFTKDGEEKMIMTDDSRSLSPANSDLSSISSLDSSPSTVKSSTKGNNTKPPTIVEPMKKPNVGTPKKYHRNKNASSSSPIVNNTFLNKNVVNAPAALFAARHPPNQMTSPRLGGGVGGLHHHHHHHRSMPPPPSAMQQWRAAAPPHFYENLYPHFNNNGGYKPAYTRSHFNNILTV